MTQVGPVEQGLDNIARPWFDGGFSVIPILPDGTKRPAVRWADYMTRTPTELEVAQWWDGGSDYGVAVICGQVSGNVEMLELEADATSAEALSAIAHECDRAGIRELWDEVSLRGYAEITPTGGLHMIYRIGDHDVPGNAKVAQTETRKTLVETRGQGGYVIVAPTPGTCHSTGEAWETVGGVQGQVSVISWAQREALHAAIREALDRTPVTPVTIRQNELVRATDDLRPGDDFNARADWRDILTPHGWTIFTVRGGTTYWTRPGKNRREGHSATTGYSETGDRMYCFSSSAGLPVEESMTKLYVYAHLNHGGDMVAAVRELANRGFGAQRDLSWRDDEIMEASVTSTNTALVERDSIGELESAGKVPQRLFDTTETDVGNAERLAIKAKNRFAYNHVARRWMMYTGTAWEYDDIESIFELARAVAKEIVFEGIEMMDKATTAAELKAGKRHRTHGMASQSDSRIRSMVRQYASFPSAAMTNEMLDQAAGKLNVGNGLLDLETLELEPSSAEHRMSMTFGAEFKPSAEAPRFRALINDLFPDPELQDYMQRVLGYSLTGESNQRAFFLLHGPAGTGKSTLTKLMVRLFGDYGHVASEDTFQINQNATTTSLHELRKKRFVCTSELPRDAGMNENLLKRITGGDPITSRTLYQREQTWYPECALFVATNFLPRISGDDDALWRRAKVIEMNQQFGVPGRPDVKNLAEEILAQEADGILNWLLEGLVAYRQCGLDEPVSVEETAVTYRQESDPVAAFLSDEFEDGTFRRVAGAIVPVATMYSRYEEFCKRNRYQPMGIRRVHARMRALGYESSKYGGRRVWQDIEMNLADRFMIGA